MRHAFALICIAACAGKPRATVAPGAEPIAVPLTAASTSATTAPLVREDFAPPFTLTASDGSGLVLTRVAAKAVVEGPLAFTELHLFFKNTEARMREGTFQITLPQRAAISRFAMENAGSWMEAEVVPKLEARRVYEDFLHRKQDPALLEKAAGNQFTARVFPIFANAEKHLVISYSQELPGTRYVLPLRGLPRAERVEVELAFVRPDGTRATQSLVERDWQADRDFIASAVANPTAVGAGNYVAAQVEVVASTTRDVPRGITLLVDTSASRALGFEAYVGSVKRLVGELATTWGDALPLQIIAFDQDTQLVFEGRADELRDLHVRKLVERGAAGASDIGQALEWIGRRGALSRIVVVGDGVITAGAEGRELQAIVKKLAKVERIDVILAGGLRDDRTAALLVNGATRAGAVLDLHTDSVATALGESVATNIAIEVPGAMWVYPRTIASARSGTRTMVFARLANPSPSIDVIATSGANANATANANANANANAVRRSLRVLPVTPPLVERAIASAEIAELEAAPKTEALRKQIAQKSVSARVLSSETSMLVLEREQDYERYKIDRKALADVLVVGKTGVERVPRANVAAIPTRVDGPAVAAKPSASPPSASPPSASPPSASPPSGLPPSGSHVARHDVVTVHRPALSSSAGDTDRDAIADADDRCPSEPETANGLEDDDGCPDRGRVVMTSTSIEVLENVHFEHRSAAIMPRSLPLLDAIVTTLQGNPDITLIEIQGHTDERGDDAANLRLSTRRARAVRDYLVAKGIAASRLEATGYGETMPVDARHNERAWAKNRRVDFLILKRAGDSSPMLGRRVDLDRKPEPPAPPPLPPPPVTGELAAIQRAIGARDLDGALSRARDWHAREPGNVLALVGLGEALEALHADATAARVYGSIIDLFPGRADLRRFAGERLGRISNAKHLAVDTFRRAVADRPDHLTGHRLLAYALVRVNHHADAFAAILAGLTPTHAYRGGSFEGGRELLRTDASMIGAVYANAVPAKRIEIVQALAKHGLSLATKPSTRFVLYWETDANDVDLHVRDARGAHAYYKQQTLPSGGTLLADVTTGYGPEVFTIDGAPKAAPYQLAVEYYEQGPMGYGMGLLQIVRFDPKAGFRFDDRPFVITTPRARLELGAYRP